MNPTTNEIKHRLSIRRFAKTIVLRQKKKNASTILYIYGPQGSGKSTLMMRIIREFVFIKRSDYVQGNSEWNVPKRWSKIFEDHFAGDVDELINMTKATIKRLDDML